MGARLEVSVDGRTWTQVGAVHGKWDRIRGDWRGGILSIEHRNNREIQSYLMFGKVVRVRSGQKIRRLPNMVAVGALALLVGCGALPPRIETVARPDSAACDTLKTIRVDSMREIKELWQ